MACAKLEDWVLFLEESLSPSEQEQLSLHLQRCSRCRSAVEDLQSMTLELSASAQPIVDETLVRDIMTKVKASKGRSRLWLWLGPAVMLAALALLGIRFESIASRFEESRKGVFSPRGQVQSQTDQWTAIHVYAVKSKQKLEPVVDRIHAHEALAFSYESSAAEGYRYLVVFAVDASAKVFWYYPAYTDARTNPCGIELAKGSETTLLKESIRHSLQPGPLRIFAVFSKQRYCVKELETIIDAQKASLMESRLNLPDSSQSIMNVRVQDHDTKGP